MLRRAIACTLLLCYLAACTSWHVKQGVGPLQLISTEHPRTVRVTRTDGRRIFLDEPRIAGGDSLVGVHSGVQLASPSRTSRRLRPRSSVLRNRSA